MPDDGDVPYLRVREEAVHHDGEGPDEERAVHQTVDGTEECGRRGVRERERGDGAENGHRFEARDGALHGDGTAWDPTTGWSDDGRRLSPVAARRLYAFAWQDNHGPDSFYGLD